MAGLLKSQAPDAETPVEDKPEPQDQQGEVTPQAVRAKMTLPPQLRQAYDKVVLAGMKVMFDPSTHQQAMGMLQGEGPIDTRLAKAVAVLMGTLIKQSNNTMPPAVIIPAGIELIAAAGDFLKKGGQEPVTDDDIAGAMAEYVTIIMEQAGAKNPQDMQQMVKGAQQQGA
jgi:hypothetical protein